MNRFAVDADDGNITTKNVEFDAEVRTEYTFTVICSDKRGRSASVLVTLTCNDENDNSPQFQRSEIQIFEEEFDEIANMPDDAIGNVLVMNRFPNIIQFLKRGCELNHTFERSVVQLRKNVLNILLETSSNL